MVSYDNDDASAMPALGYGVVTRRTGTNTGLSAAAPGFKDGTSRLLLDARSVRHLGSAK